MSPSAKTADFTLCPKMFTCVHFQKEPPGASFRNEPFSVHEWSTDQIWSESFQAFSSYRMETVFRWHHLVAPCGTTWGQFSKGTFLCPWVIHRPNLKWIGQSVLKLSHRNHFQMDTWWHHLVPVFERNLPLSMSDPLTKFEANRPKGSRVIAWKPFSDGGTWWHQTAQPGGHFWKELFSVQE